jgi:hypothetical protein
VREPVCVVLENVNKSRSIRARAVRKNIQAIFLVSTLNRMSMRG